MLRMIGTAALAANFATAAAAQQTTCQTFGNTTTCNTQQPFVNPPSPSPWATNPLPQQQPYMAPPPYQGRGLIGEFMDAMLKKKVGSLIAAGQCDEAKRTALRAGNFEMAQQVVMLCQPPQTSAPPPQANSAP